MTDQFVIDPNTHLGPICLRVPDLERSLHFYSQVLGLSISQRQDNTAWLTTDGTTPLLVLVEQPGARPKPPRTTGLYHFAILVPSRVALAHALQHLLEVRYPLQGAADHLVSEALYLADPDGNGIEIYADRPRDAWPQRHGQLQMATDPLDVSGLLAELDGGDHAWSGLLPQTCVGHIHLHVADLRQAEAFYCDVLGFDRVTYYPLEKGASRAPSALFVSAGGYHHHLGLNVWAGVGAPPPPPDSAGLRFYTICLPHEEALGRLVDQLKSSGIEFEHEAGVISLQDPSGNAIRLEAGNTAAIPGTPATAAPAEL